MKPQTKSKIGLSALMALALSSAFATPTYTLKVAVPGMKNATPAVVTKTIVAAGASRTWSDGQPAASCKAYLVGDATHAYQGATGSGVYTIAPLGTPVSTYCDMTTDGGGWTLTAFNRGNSGTAQVPANFFVTKINAQNLADRTSNNMAGSLNVEAVSKALNTNDVMLVAPAYSSSPILEKNRGTWNYDTPDCTAPLGHTGRTGGCGNHAGNDDYTTFDSFNIAIYGGNTGIEPYYLNAGNELCWSGRGWCGFEFYVR